MSAVWAQDALTKGTNTTTVDTDVIKILPTDFRGEYIFVIDNDSSNFAVRAGAGSFALWTKVHVPLGYTATKVKINGSETNNYIEVYTVNLDNGTLSDEISNTGLNVNEDLDLDTYHVGKNNNALAIMANTFDTGDKIYGGYVTIQRS